MLLQSLPRLPFVCAFDILFRHGGIAGGLQRIFTSGTELFDFMETVFGNGTFGETIRACHLVYSLKCPADALYLLHPVDKTIPESVGAWSVAAAHSDAYWLLPVRRDLMIRAVRVFLPKGPVYDWLDSSEFSTKRTMRQWVEFAHEFIQNHRFTARWWRENGEWWVSETMGAAILIQVEEEARLLKKRLWRDECRQMMKEKMDSREEQNEERGAAEEEAAEKKKNPVPKVSMQPKKGAVPQGAMQPKKGPKGPEKKKTPQKTRLSGDEIACAENSADQLLIKHRNVLKLVKSALSQRISTHTFDTRFVEIARLVMTLAQKEFRKIKWALKAEFHHAAGDRLGFESWHIERELCRQAFRPAENALERLRALR